MGKSENIQSSCKKELANLKAIDMTYCSNITLIGKQLIFKLLTRNLLHLTKVKAESIESIVYNLN